VSGVVVPMLFYAILAAHARQTCGDTSCPSHLTFCVDTRSPPPPPHPPHVGHAHRQQPNVRSTVRSLCSHLIVHCISWPHPLRALPVPGTLFPLPNGVPLTHAHCYVANLTIREPGRVHCVELPAMVQSVAATISYSRSCDNASLPRVSDEYEGDTVVDPPPQLTEGEKAIFSGYVSMIDACASHQSRAHLLLVRAGLTLFGAHHVMLQVLAAQARVLAATHPPPPTPHPYHPYHRRTSQPPHVLRGARHPYTCRVAPPNVHSVLGPKFTQ
jgi:hypothetical protein